MPWRRARIGLRPVAVAGAVLVGALAGCGGEDGGEASQPELHGLVRPEPLQVGDLRLPEVTSGDAGALAPLRAGGGGYMALFFGFTQCPDLCPVTLATFSSALERLPASQAATVEVAMVTVDPATDGPAQLREFLGGFSENYRAFRPVDREQLAPVEARVYAASFEEPASSAGHETGSHGSDDGHNPAGGEAAGHGGSMMSHTGYLYLVDDSGAVVVEWPAGTTAGQYAADLERILPAGTTTDDEG